MIPDDQRIKAEIEDISRRIDHIVKTVNRSISQGDSSEDASTSDIAGRGDGIIQQTEQSNQKTE